MTLTLLAGLASFLVALVATALLVPPVRRMARARGFVDRPGGHKGHAEATPLGGGIAIVAGMLIPLLGGAAVVIWLSGLAAPPPWLPPELAVHVRGAVSKLPQLGAIAACLAAVTALGLVDDRRGLSPWLRLAVHLGAGAVLWLVDVRITLFVASPVLSLILTSLWIAGITSAFNMLDNMDGLSSGVAVIVALVLAGALATPAPQLFVIALLLCIAGASLGFWLHNRPPATIFMGDAGSTALGFMLGAATTLATFYGDAGRTQAHAVAIPLLVMAIPLYDMASVVVLRLARGVSPFSPDRNHFSHRLTRLGLTPWATLATIYLATLTTGLGALLVDRVPLSGALILIAQGVLVLGIIATLEIAAAWQTRQRPTG